MILPGVMKKGLSEVVIYEFGSESWERDSYTNIWGEVSHKMKKD